MIRLTVDSWDIYAQRTKTYMIISSLAQHV